MTAESNLRPSSATAAFGLLTSPEVGSDRGRIEAIDRPGEARLALLVLGGGLAFVYATSAVTLLSRLPRTGAVLACVAALQVCWLWLLRERRAAPLVIGSTLNLALAAVWLASRTTGLPSGTSPAQPIGLLDTLCAIDSLLIAAIALGLSMSTGWRRVLLSSPLNQCAIVLTAASLSALAGGHGHYQASRGAAADASTHHTYLCRLL